MTFKGDAPTLPVKATALVVAGTVWVSAAHHAPFCWYQPGSYCELVWDLPHPPHNDHRQVPPQPPTLSSTSGSSTALR